MAKTMNVTEALTIIKNGDAVLIDVREPDEFKAEHIAYAMSVPLSSIEEGFKFLDIPSNKTILFQCLKGTRGQMACDRVEGAQDRTNDIANIEGGIEAWKEKGLPVIRAGHQGHNLSVFRQVQIIVGALVALSVLLGFIGMTTAFVVAGILGVALLFAGLSGWCGLALLLSKMPWNK